MALSFDKLNRTLNKSEKLTFMIYKIVRRSFLLFAMGMILINNGYDVTNWRIPGVLQRFGVSYGVIAFVVVFVPKINSEHKYFKDIIQYIF